MKAIPIWPPRVVSSWKILQLIEQDMQKWSFQQTYEWVERSPWVRILFQNSSWDICLTREWRSELNERKWWYDYRLPWWKVFDTLDEYIWAKDNLDLYDWAIKKAVIREWREECWIDLSDCDLIHISRCWALVNRDLLYFLVTDFSFCETWQELDGMEEIDVHRFSPDKVVRMCLDWDILEGRTVAVLLRQLLTVSEGWIHLT